MECNKALGFRQGDRGPVPICCFMCVVNCVNGNFLHAFDNFSVCYSFTLQLLFIYWQFKIHLYVLLRLLLTCVCHRPVTESNC